MARKKTWVLVSDAAGGRFFEVSDNTKLVPAYKHEIRSALPESGDIQSDKPGRTFDSGGQGRHAMEPPTDPKRHAKAEMAHTLSNTLDGQRKKNAFDRLIVVAPPQFLGDLREAMPKPLHDLVAKEIAKDLSKLKVHELERQLAGVIKVRPPL